MALYSIFRLPSLTSPSLRGSGLKSAHRATCQKSAVSPSLRGSGLKYRNVPFHDADHRLPLYEGVD